MTLQKVTGVLVTNRHFGTAGNAVEAIFFLVAILLRLKIYPVTIVLVS